MSPAMVEPMEATGRMQSEQLPRDSNIRDSGNHRPNMPDLVHLALGDSAAGCLRAACRSHGLPGTVLSIPDDLSHGPLVHGCKRIKYMRSCYRGYDDWTFDVTDAFSPWKKLIEWLEGEESEAIVIWSGDNVSEATFLAMACWQLRQRPDAVLRVAISERDNSPYVALHMPFELGDLYANRRELTDSERALLGDEFVRIRSESGLLRRWENGRIIGVPVDHYDRFLLESCATAWLPAPRVIGAAMGRCDKQNLMSDLVFSSRLQFLIDAQRIKADRGGNRMREYAVRRVES
jgi:hypothetical protein